MSAVDGLAPVDVLCTLAVRCCRYYIRYLQPWNTEKLVDPEAEKYWLPVDLYVGECTAVDLQREDSQASFQKRLAQP